MAAIEFQKKIIPLDFCYPVVFDAWSYSYNKLIHQAFQLSKGPEGKGMLSIS